MPVPWSDSWAEKIPRRPGRRPARTVERLLTSNNTRSSGFEAPPPTGGAYLVLGPSAKAASDSGRRGRVGFGARSAASRMRCSDRAERGQSAEAARRFVRRVLSSSAATKYRNIRKSRPSTISFLPHARITHFRCGSRKDRCWTCCSGAAIVADVKRGLPPAVSEAIRSTAGPKPLCERRRRDQGRPVRRVPVTACQPRGRWGGQPGIRGFEGKERKS
jgi:hypothetical protein